MNPRRSSRRAALRPLCGQPLESRSLSSSPVVGGRELIWRLQKIVWLRAAFISCPRQSVEESELSLAEQHGLGQIGFASVEIFFSDVAVWGHLGFDDGRR